MGFTTIARTAAQLRRSLQSLFSRKIKHRFNIGHRLIGPVPQACVHRRSINDFAGVKNP